jgi:phosphotransferase system HPr-like phosphotransfer protein
MRVRIYLDTNSACNRFCETVRGFGGKGELVNESGRYRVSAASLMGCLMASAEWGGVIYFESEEDRYTELEEWIADTADDNISIHE